MAATMVVMIGYIIGNLLPNALNVTIRGPVFMALVAIVFAHGVSWIAYR